MPLSHLFTATPISNNNDGQQIKVTVSVNASPNNKVYNIPDDTFGQILIFSETESSDTLDLDTTPAALLNIQSPEPATAPSAQPASAQPKQVNSNLKNLDALFRKQPGNFSLCLWVYFATSVEILGQGITYATEDILDTQTILRHGSSGDQNWWKLGLNDKQCITFQISDKEGTRYTIEASQPLPLNNWVQISVTYNFFTLTLSLNSRVAAQTACPSTQFFNTQDSLNIDSAAFKGRLGQISVADYALSRDELYAQYLQQVQKNRSFSFDVNNDQLTVVYTPKLTNADTDFGWANINLAPDQSYFFPNPSQLLRTSPSASDFTLCQWAKQSDGSYTLCLDGDSSPWSLIIESNTFAFHGVESVSVATSFNNPNWIHTAITYTSLQGGTLTLYVNGYQCDQKTGVSVNFWSQIPLSATVHSSNKTVGALSIFGKALTAEAVLEQFKNDLGESTPCFDLAIDPETRRVTYTPLVTVSDDGASTQPTPIRDPWLGPCLEFGSSTHTSIVSPQLLLPTVAHDDGNSLFILSFWVRPTGDRWNIFAGNPSPLLPDSSELNTRLAIGGWNHVAVNYDGTTLTYYINGQQSGTPQPSSNDHWWTSLPTHLLLGHSGNDSFQGRLGPITVYRGAQTSKDGGHNIEDILREEIEALVPTFLKQPILDIAPSPFLNQGEQTFLVNASPKGTNIPLTSSTKPTLVPTDAVGNSLSFAASQAPISLNQEFLRNRLTKSDGSMRSFTLETWVKTQDEYPTAILYVEQQWALLVGEQYGFSNHNRQEIKKSTQTHDWTHLAITYNTDSDQKKLSFYINGYPVAQPIDSFDLGWTRGQSLNLGNPKWLQPFSLTSNVMDTLRALNLVTSIATLKNFIVTGNSDNSVTVWKEDDSAWIPDGQLIDDSITSLSSAHSAPVTSVALAYLDSLNLDSFNPDTLEPSNPDTLEPLDDTKIIIITGGFDNRVKIWVKDRDTWTLVHELQASPGDTAHTAPITCISTLPVLSDSQLLVATGGLDKKVKIWNLSYGVGGDLTPLSYNGFFELKDGRDDSTHSASVTSVALMMLEPDESPGLVAVTGGLEHKAKVWDIQWDILTCALICELQDPSVPDHNAHDGPVMSVTMVKNIETQETFIITGGADNKAKKWLYDLSYLPNNLLNTVDHSAPITSVEFSVNPSFLITVGMDNKIKVWTDDEAGTSTYFELMGIFDGSMDPIVHPPITSIAVDHATKKMVVGSCAGFFAILQSPLSDGPFQIVPPIVLDIEAAKQELSGEGAGITTSIWSNYSARIWQLPQSKFNGQLAHIRLHDRCLLQTEIQTNLDRDFRVGSVGSQIIPLEFDLQNPDGDTVLYLGSGHSSLDVQSLTLTLKNTSSQAVRLPSSQTTQLNLLELQFRPGTLRNPGQITLTGVTLSGTTKTDDNRNWTLTHVPETDGTDSLHLQRTTQATTLGANDTITFNLSGFQVDNQGGSRSTRVQLRYALQTLGDRAPLSGSRQHYLSIVPMDATGLATKMNTLQDQTTDILKDTTDHELTLKQLRADLNQLAQVIYQVAGAEKLAMNMLQSAPITSGIKGSATILNDGKSTNTLQLYIANTSQQALTLDAHTSQFILELHQYNASQAPWGLLIQNDNAPTVSGASNWTMTASTAQIGVFSYEFTPQQSLSQPLGIFLTVNLSFQSSAPNGSGSILVRYEGLKQQGDQNARSGLLSVPIQRTPILIPDNSPGNSPGNSPSNSPGNSPDNSKNRTVISGELDIIEESKLTFNPNPYSELSNALPNPQASIYLKSAQSNPDAVQKDVNKAYQTQKDAESDYKKNQEQGSQERLKQNLQKVHETFTTARETALEKLAALAIESDTAISLKGREIELLAKVNSVEGFNAPLMISDGLPTGKYQPTEHRGIYYEGHPGHLVPTGAILMWSGSETEIPPGWQLCDGTPPTPNLKGRFLVGVGTLGSSTYKSGQPGGTDSIRLTEAQMPRHSHKVNINDPGHTHNMMKLRTSSTDVDDSSLLIYARDRENAYVWPTGNSKTKLSSDNVTLDYKGDNQPFDNRPPFYALCFIMKL